jgi:surfeit locus 1 family protein
MLSARGQRWVILLGALTMAALTARLGVWQLDRAAQKRALQQAIVERAKLPPLDERALALTPAQAEAQHWRLVRLQGRWRAERTVFLDNRQMDGRPGFFVVTPLEIHPGDAVLVQRGWVARDPLERTKLPPIDTPSGVVQVQGRIAPPPSRLFDFGAEERGAIRQNLDLAAYSKEIGLPLRPLSVQQLGDGADGLGRHWPLPALDLSKHYGYAFQWFAMAALITGLYVWFQLLRPRLGRP